GPDKSDNTPHELNIGGKKVECFFSPSDDTNNQLLRAIQSADNELYFATMVFTRFDLAYGVEERVDLYGVYAAGILDDSSGGSGTSFQIMQGVMGNNLLLFDHSSNPGILHHKYLIVDQGYASADPLVLTGSHNWSSNANIRNDENTIIIHDAAIANQFYQEFHNLFNGNGGNVGTAEFIAAKSIYIILTRPAVILPWNLPPQLIKPVKLN
ncbi:MAG: phospholipase D-like domain-containing protein, partial [Saprospiraceae bacterium]